MVFFYLRERALRWRYAIGLFLDRYDLRSK